MRNGGPVDRSMFVLILYMPTNSLLSRGTDNAFPNNLRVLISLLLFYLFVSNYSFFIFFIFTTLVPRQSGDIVALLAPFTAPQGLERLFKRKNHLLFRIQLNVCVYYDSHRYIVIVLSLQLNYLTLKLKISYTQKKKVGFLAISDEEKANVFGIHHSNIFTSHSNTSSNPNKLNEIEIFLGSSLPMSLLVKHTSSREIQFFILKLKNEKSPSYDLITNKMLKFLSEKSIILLTYLATQC